MIYQLFARDYSVQKITCRCCASRAMILKRHRNEETTRMLDYFLIGGIALLYVLGMRMGSSFADCIDDSLAKSNEELDNVGRFMLTWGWPVATVIAIVEGDE